MPYCGNLSCFQVVSECKECGRGSCELCSPNSHNDACSGKSNNNNSNNFSWESLFPELIGSSPDTLASSEVVGLYFSAHWCPPCRGFTPVLAEIYKDLKQHNKNIEIVFVSSDKDEASFQAYFEEMPWLALPYKYRAEKQQLSERFGVKGIPMLVLLSGQSGEVITRDGRKVIQEGGVEGFPYSASHLEQLKQVKMQKRNELLKNEMGGEMKLFGEYAWGPNDSRVKLSEVARHDVIGVLFGDNAAFLQYVLPAMNEVYNEVRAKHGENAFEVIFVPWEGEENVEEDKLLRSKLPFPSIDHLTLTPEVREKLSLLFGPTIQSPGIALLTQNGGEILSVNAMREVYETRGAGYPWTPQVLHDLQEAKKLQRIQQRENLKQFKLFENNKLVSNNSASNNISSSELTENKMVGLYFSAHWCGPCRAFTPRLISLYNDLKSKNEKFEIIFVSSDNDKESFEKYYGTMPWLALAYEERALKESMSEMFEVDGIPTLIFLDGNGSQLDVNGRSAVMMGAEFYPWDEPQLQRFSVATKIREAELKAQAELAERRSLEEQKAQGNGVFERLRGKSGVSKISGDHVIEFGSFDTFGAPSSLASKGKVFYEVQIIDLEESIQQFGWADSAFEKTQGPTGEGTGDDEHSYAVDGARVQKWHDGSSEFGLEWNDGDILGCAANLDSGELLFGLNGNWEAPMGVAFTGVNPQGGLYPCLTANAGNFQVNLGGRPFKFGPPDDTYSGVVRK